MITNTKQLIEKLVNNANKLHEILDKLYQNQDENLLRIINDFKLDKAIKISDESACNFIAQIAVYDLMIFKLDNNDGDIYKINDGLITDLIKISENAEDDDLKSIFTIMNETLDILNDTDFSCIKAAVGDNLKLYLYEEFYRAYDFENSKNEGVFYTPAEVIHFINRAVTYIANKHFDVKDMADAEVLDFATGTGGFLNDMIKRTLENSNDKKAAFEKIKKNYSGYEINPVSANIAKHLINKTLNEFGINEEINIIKIKNTLQNDAAQRA